MGKDSLLKSTTPKENQSGPARKTTTPKKTKKQKPSTTQMDIHKPTKKSEDLIGAGNSAPLFPGHPETPDPVQRIMLYGMATLALMVVLIIAASARNHSRYFLMAQNDAVEIWRGRFSPTGREFYSILHNYHLTEPIKPYYSRQEVFPVIFNYYLQKADDVLDMHNPLDFLTITNYLKAAQQHALTDQMQHAVLIRMNAIEQMTLLYKADVAIMVGTPHSLELAIQYLNEAKALTRSSAQRQVIEERIASVQARLKAVSQETNTGRQPNRPTTPENTPTQ